MILVLIGLELKVVGIVIDSGSNEMNILLKLKLKLIMMRDCSYIYPDSRVLSS